MNGTQMEYIAIFLKNYKYRKVYHINSYDLQAINHQW